MQCSKLGQGSLIGKGLKRGMAGLQTLWRHRCAHCCPVLPGIFFATDDHLPGRHKVHRCMWASVEIVSCLQHLTVSVEHQGCWADLFPSFACHSASRSSSSGIHEPVLTGRPLMWVGIGILRKPPAQTAGIIPGGISSQVLLAFGQMC